MDTNSAVALFEVWFICLVILLPAAVIITVIYVNDRHAREENRKRHARFNRRISRLEDRVGRAYKWVDKVTTWADSQCVSKERTLFHVVADALHNDDTPWCWGFHRRLTVAQQLVEKSARLVEYVKSPHHDLWVLDERYMRNYNPRTMRPGIPETNLDRLRLASEKLEEELSLLQDYLDGTAEQ